MNTDSHKNLNRSLKKLAHIQGILGSPTAPCASASCDAVFFELSWHETSDGHDERERNLAKEWNKPRK